MNLVTSRRPTREATGAPKWPLLGCQIRHPRYATLARFGLSQRTNELDQVFVSRQRELEQLDRLLDDRRDDPRYVELIRSVGFSDAL